MTLMFHILHKKPMTYMLKSCDTDTDSISPRQLEFLKKELHTKRTIATLRILLLLAFLLLWELTSKYGMIDSFFFSSPSKVFASFLFSIKEKQLFMHVSISLLETLVSFLLIMLFSLLTASVLWRFDMISKILEPLLVLLNSLPKSALAPLIIVWLGTGIKTIGVCGISVAIFGCSINLYTAFLSVEPEKQKLITILGGKKRHIFTMVILPSNLGTIVSNMKVNIGLALVGVMIGEFLAAKRGLGYLIIYSSQVFELDLLILCIVILCIIAVILYQTIHFVEKKICA